MGSSKAPGKNVPASYYPTSPNALHFSSLMLSITLLTNTESSSGGMLNSEVNLKSLSAIVALIFIPYVFFRRNQNQKVSFPGSCVAPQY
jgi:hypothetical protein